MASHVSSSASSSTGLYVGQQCSVTNCSKDAVWRWKCRECASPVGRCLCESHVSTFKCPICGGSGDSEAGSGAKSSLKTFMSSSSGTACNATAEVCSGPGHENIDGLKWDGTPRPRSYQWQAFREAAVANCIINLPTGTGKTLIAVMLADCFLKREPSKNVMLLVNTVPLVRQQANVVRRSSETQGLPVVELTGSEVQWTESWWQELCRDYKVLVGVAEVFRKALVDHGFINIKQMSLLIFDEAHHAVGNHPYATIVYRCLNSKSDGELAETGPRLVGLTASYLHGKMVNPEKKRMKLEVNLRSHIWAPDPQDLGDHVSEQKFERISYEDTCMPEDWARKQTDKLLEDVLADGVCPKNIETQLRKLAVKAGHMFELLGRKGWQFFITEALCPMVQASLETKERVFDKQGDKDKIKRTIPHLQELQNTLRRYADAVRQQTPKSELVPDISGKAAALVERLKELKEEDDVMLRSIVFVEQVATTYPLAALINEHLESQICRPVSGVNSMPDRVRNQNLDAFANGQAQILVATNAAEEGIDIAACNSVFRFDVFHNVKSHVQGAGRARQKDALIFYFENDPEAEQRDAERMLEVARGPAGPKNEQAASASKPWSAKHPFPFLHPTTEAHVTAQNCLSILYEYVARVLKKSVPPEQIFVCSSTSSTDASGAVIEKCLLPVPTSEGKLEVSAEQVDDFWCKARDSGGPASAADFRELVREDMREVSWSDLAWDRRRFAYVAVLELLNGSYIDEHNMPSERALLDTSEYCKDFLEIEDRCSASHRVRYNPRSLTKQPESGASLGVVADTREAQPVELVELNTVTGQQSLSAGSSEVNHGGALPNISNSPAQSTTAKSNSNTLRNSKGKLNEQMQLILKRPVQKSDIIYEATAGPPFVATVTLARLEGTPRFEGHASCGKKIDAEQSAASQALDAMDSWRSLRPCIAPHSMSQGMSPCDKPRAPAVREDNGRAFCPVQRQTSQPGQSEVRETSAHVQPRSHVTVLESQTSSAAQGTEVPADHWDAAVQQGARNPQTLASTDTQASACLEMNIREWCALQQLPESLAERLEEEEVQNPGDLTALSDEELDEFCASIPGLKLGKKGRFKRCVRDLR